MTAARFRWALAGVEAWALNPSPTAAQHGATAGTVTVLDTSAFATTVVPTCTGARGLSVFGDATAGWSFLVGCADGTVKRVDVSTDGAATLADSTFTLGTGPVLAVETDGNTIWAITDESGTSVAQAISLTDGASIEGFGQSLSNNTIEDTVLSSDSLIVAQHRMLEAWLDDRADRGAAP